MDVKTNDADPSLALVQDSARAFAARVKDHKVLREERFKLPWHEQARLAELAGLGWFGAVIPEEFGGSGLTFSEMSAICEELGSALLAEPLIPLGVLAPRAILHGDNQAVKTRLLAEIASGTVFTALAWQESNEDASDPTAITTRATQNGSSWHLDGRKRFVAGAWAAGGFVVSALTTAGMQLFHVAADAEGLKLSQEWRADGSPAGALELAHVRTDAVIAGPACASQALRRALDEAAILAAAELVGVMREAFAITVQYLKTRVAFGQTISKFQALQHRTADLFVRHELAKSTLGHALRVADGAPSASDLAMASSRAKARCGEVALQVTREAIQLHGAIGFTDECDVGLYLKRALVLSAWLGSAATHHARLSSHEAFNAVAGDDDRIAGNGADMLARMSGVPIERRDWNGLSDADFRACARTFIEANLPRDLRFLPKRIGWAEMKDWYLCLSREGWLAPAWPPAYGGMGLNAAKLLIYDEEMERLGSPRLMDHGINNVGSILLTRGSEEQRRHYLPKVLSGEHLWCQGYSEPNAGSDLASLRTEAHIEGDEFVITGQKIWTTFAHHANHIYTLVRTDKSKPRHEGISFLLIDMRQPGVTVRPITNIVGHVEFCEVFFDRARTPRSNIVGDLNDGWAVSRAVLGFERLRVGSPRIAMRFLQRLLEVARRLDLAADPLVRNKLTRLICDVRDLASLFEKVADTAKSGAAPGPEASALKLLATEAEQHVSQALVEVLGDAGVVSGAQDFNGYVTEALTPFLLTRAVTIYGGTSEVQRNIIAKRILGM
ncbi:acyl-CoA dehydrogenase [Bradyrhizobium sp. LHD-71]|uniref:acyl-CoA dehydrogenase n=1 Tax=Bradyrhizobium sp. LHD-71 TaxID=3072141 RepID=UPI00280C83EA|nr:acyl-CoA dehydrogenase [Bradyrhizobium sp. LHD-71]MDQ8728204.1 acyl-CoA dehydrogenase [Bradyrhizobium sp. LHD-71]